MAGAVIVANQADGAGDGSPGIARNDLWLSQEIQLVVGTAGNTSIEWALLDSPDGSAATLADSSQSGGGPYADCTFTPDLPGTYRVQLVTNGGGPGNVQILVLRVRYNSSGVLVNRGWALPAKGEIEGESNYNGNMRAWAEVFEFIFADILEIMTGSLGPPVRFVFPGVAGLQTTDVSTFTTVGALSFNAGTDVPTGGGIVVSPRFRFIVATENVVGLQIEIRLYNLTDGEVVTGTTTLVAAGTITPTAFTTALTIGTSSGNLKTGQSNYAIQIRRVNGSASDNVFCYLGQVELVVTGDD